MNSIIDEVQSLKGEDGESVFLVCRKDDTISAVYDGTRDDLIEIVIRAMQSDKGIRNMFAMALNEYASRMSKINKLLEDD